MHKTVLAITVATILSLMVIPAVWAGAGEQTTALSNQCQAALKKTPNAEAAKLCEEGDALRKQGKHDEATAKLTDGLEKLGVKVQSPKMY